MNPRKDKGEIVDHINGNALDNRRCNLRLATYTLNSHNRRKRIGSTSIYKGVALVDGKWNVYICKNGKKEYLGAFLDEVKAAQVYDERARELYGNDASTNFS